VRPGARRATPEVTGLDTTGLGDVVDQVLAGTAVRPPVVVITGPVGSGKTALLQEIEDAAAARGARLLRATGSAAEHGIPYEVVRQLLRGGAPRAGTTPAGTAAATPPDITTPGITTPTTGTAATSTTGASTTPTGTTAGTTAGTLTGTAARTPTDTTAAGTPTGTTPTGTTAAGTPTGTTPTGTTAAGTAAAGTAAAYGAALLDLAAGGPLLVVVDDVHQADEPSLRCLAYLARRLGPEPVLLVLAEAPRIRHRDPEAYAELFRAAPLRRVRLAGPTGEEVRDRAGARAAEFERIAGGNALLLGALLEDGPTGEPFREAVLSCLHRCEPAVVAVVRALAVTGWATADPRLPLLLAADRDAAAAVGSVHAATAAGLVTGGRLSDPAVARAVLDGMPLDERTALHRRVAGLVHRDGGAPALVAPHLLEAGEPSEPWMARCLLAAAEQELRDGAPEAALRYLRRLHHARTTPELAARVTAALARAEWRLDPDGAARHLGPVAAEVRAGRLGPVQAAPAIRQLLWDGRPAEAAELAGYATRAAAGADPEAVAELFLTLCWTAALHPGGGCSPAAFAADHRDPVTLLLIRHRLRGITALRTVLERGADPRAVAEAEHVLATAAPDESTLWSVLAALVALVLADRLAEAEQWCVRLTDDTQPTVTAVLTALRATAAVRGGDLPEAYRLGHTALAALSPRGWGLAAALPLAAAVRACTALGRLDEAAGLLRRPLPAALLQSPLGLPYLHARGRYSLAAGRPESAQDDFHLAGRLMAEWGLDRPALVGWRTEVARARLDLGRPGQAARLAREELDRLGPGQLRPRGAALRVLAAATDDGAERLALLREAVPLLEAAGDRLELLAALGDLSQAHQQLGQHREARTAARSARQLAERCGLPEDAPAEEAPPPVSVLPVDGLSTAESRVARLVAQGHTNREIAGKLFVVEGTVEQRLTRIYRKLDVHSRAELTARLLPGTPAAPRSTPVTPHHPGNRTRRTRGAQEGVRPTEAM
jgi:DNA-binding CsgD family transcriptional regulator